FEPVAQAVATALLGPLRLKRIETFPLAALVIRRGTVNGLTRPTPRSLRILYCSSIVSMPPLPLRSRKTQRVRTPGLKPMSAHWIAVPVPATDCGDAALARADVLPHAVNRIPEGGDDA